MSKVTFLFGAGASAESIPVVNKINDRLAEVVELLKKSEFDLSDQEYFPHLPNKSKQQYRNELISDFEWLLSESKNHYSIDTFAKKLFITWEDYDLNRLKIVLSIYFHIIQSLEKPDSRYDSFLAAILKTSTTLEFELDILSWNYDFQLELAMAEYSGQRDIHHNGSLLNVNQKNLSFRHEDHPFGVFKLNGSACLADKTRFRHYIFYQILHEEFTIEQFENVVKQYGYKDLPSSDKPSSLLSFAWEEENQQSILELCTKRMENCEVLVVIGYSFPFFNRSVDRKIFGKLPKLRKIYVQDLKANEVIERIEAIIGSNSGIQLVPRFDVSQFLLPNEL